MRPDVSTSAGLNLAVFAILYLMSVSILGYVFAMAHVRDHLIKVYTARVCRIKQVILDGAIP